MKITNFRRKIGREESTLKQELFRFPVQIRIFLCLSLFSKGQSCIFRPKIRHLSGMLPYYYKRVCPYVCPLRLFKKHRLPSYNSGEIKVVRNILQTNLITWNIHLNLWQKLKFPNLCQNIFHLKPTLVFQLNFSRNDMHLKFCCPYHFFLCHH